MIRQLGPLIAAVNGTFYSVTMVTFTNYYENIAQKCGFSLMKGFPIPPAIVAEGRRMLQAVIGSLAFKRKIAFYADTDMIVFYGMPTEDDIASSLEEFDLQYTVKRYDVFVVFGKKRYVAKTTSHKFDIVGLREQ